MTRAASQSAGAFESERNAWSNTFASGGINGGRTWHRLHDVQHGRAVVEVDSLEQAAPGFRGGKLHLFTAALVALCQNQPQALLNQCFQCSPRHFAAR